MWLILSKKDGVEYKAIFCSIAPAAIFDMSQQVSFRITLWVIFLKLFQILGKKNKEMFQNYNSSEYEKGGTQ